MAIVAPLLSHFFRRVCTSYSSNNKIIYFASFSIYLNFISSFFLLSHIDEKREQQLADRDREPQQKTNTHTHTSCICVWYFTYLPTFFDHIRGTCTHITADRMYNYVEILYSFWLIRCVS